MDRGACWATVHRVAKSQTRLKRLSKHAHAVSCRCTAQRFMLVHGFPVAQLIKNPPVNAGDKEMQVPSLGQKDALEKEMATYSCILAWEIPWTEGPGGLWSICPKAQTQLSD